MSSVPGRVFWQVHRVLRAVRAMCNWLRLMDLDVADRSPLSVLGSGVVPEAEKVLRGEQATGPGEVPNGDQEQAELTGLPDISTFIRHMSIQPH